MPYKTISLWIFVVLLLLLALMVVFPSSFLIGLGAIALPILIVIQAYVILRANEESKHTFHDKWYDK